VVTSAIATSQKPINADLPSDPIPCSSSSPQYSSPDTTPAVLPSPDLSDIAETSSVTFDSILKVPCIVERVKTKRSEESKKKEKVKENQPKNKKPNAKKSNTKKPQKKVKKATGPTNSLLQKSVDTKCLCCGELWSDSHPGEEWVQCMECELWFHEDCCTSNSKTDLKCDFCLL